MIPKFQVTVMFSPKFCSTESVLDMFLEERLMSFCSGIICSAVNSLLVNNYIK